MAEKEAVLGYQFKYVISMGNINPSIFNEHCGDMFGQRGIIWRWVTYNIGTDLSRRILSASQPIDEIIPGIEHIGFVVSEYKQEQLEAAHA